MTENVLLHACCGPCAEYPLDVLISEEGLRPLLFFYNRISIQGWNGNGGLRICKSWLNYVG